jgi:amino acid transporter
MSQPSLASPSTASLAPASRLERVLGPWMATALVVGTVIGSGVFKKPSAVAASVPTPGWGMAAWVLMGVLVLCGGLAMAEVTVLYPRAGGNYVFLREAYGRLFGFLWGWVEFFMIRSASIAALAAVFAESLHDVLQHPVSREQLGLASDGPVLGFWGVQGLTVGTIAVLALVNARGTRLGGGLQLLVTTVKAGSLLFIAGLPFALAALSRAPAGVPHTDYLTASGDRPLTLAGFGAALIAVLWAYHGWMNLGPVAEEVRAPQRNIPLALLGGIGILIVLYLSANLAYAVTLSHTEIEGCKATPVASEFSRHLLGPAGGALISAAIAISTFGALNGNLLVGPRTLYAMGEDGLAPRALAEVHPRYHTPVVATAVLAAWSILQVLVGAALVEAGVMAQGKPLFDVLTDFAMFGAVVFETMAVASIFVFRRTRPGAERPYRCVGYPVVPLVYVLCFMGVLASYFATAEKRIEAYSGLGFVVAGAVVYGLFLRRRASGVA